MLKGTKMRNLALVWVLAGCLVGCDGRPPVSTYTDKRDGKVYRIVKIGSQVWFAENLNYVAEGSVCYENKAENCAKYGRLYSWETALTVCPAGTHLPTDGEWQKLVDYADGCAGTNVRAYPIDSLLDWIEKGKGGYNLPTDAGTKLKSSTGWNSDKEVPAGTNEYGFSALPGGLVTSDGRFLDAGYCGYWWSATRIDNRLPPWHRDMYYDRECVYRYYDVEGSNNRYSVRCVQDNEKEGRK
jgi:uncharacterized protein (TIGR02145 family)